MSVHIKILHEQDADGKEYGEPAFHDARIISETRNVVGYSLVLVIKKPDGGLDVERVFAVNADSVEDDAVVTDFIKTVEAKIGEIFEPVSEPSKIWVPE